MSEQLALPRPADVLMADGRIAAIRPMTAADRDGLMAAFLVSDAEHGHGLGSLLLEHLAAACRAVWATGTEVARWWDLRPCCGVRGQRRCRAEDRWLSSEP